MPEQKMFQEGEARYITKGIADKLPVIYQILLWNTVDALRDTGQEMDYLQVFQIETKESPQKEGKVIEIIHSQEMPEYLKIYEIPIKQDEESISGKIYVIDDITHATMLWAEEY